MTIWGDYHTHTVFSHGKGSMEESVVSAISLGLKEIAITDHGFGHAFYNVRKKDYDVMINERDRLRKKYPQINIYLGLETNLLGFDGNIDITLEQIKKLDIFICGYHKLVNSSIKDLFSFKIPNLLVGSTSKNNVKRKVKNTDAFIKAIEKYDIDIISHPGYGIDVYPDKIAEAAVKKDTLIELNGKRVSMSIEEIENVAKTGVKFIINSDAHSPNRIGEVSLPINKAKEAGISSQQIANVDKLPLFPNRKKRLI